jgi:hypothetical protein
MDWVNTDLGIAGLVIIGAVYVATKFIDKQEKSKNENVSDCLIDFTKANTELVNVIKSQQDEFRRSSEKQQEAMQGMILAINNLVSLSKETLDRVKDIDRR